ncbi:callose synthase 10-like protein [Corchorus olitorius]|uniref:Callose synthase 10-like protein n=1 Tax=Corchorus olitorius TaxID=93759 RepID=A0A1R3K165_9ROSI|nr:callose synthase 10-like protein [Corchorus olitorius]
MAIVENGELKTEPSGTNKRRFEDDSYAYIVMEKFHNVYLLFCLFIQCLVAEINKYPSKVIDSSARTLPRRQLRNLTSSAYQAHEFSALDPHSLHPPPGLERRGYRQCSSDIGQDSCCL